MEKELKGMLVPFKIEQENEDDTVGHRCTVCGWEGLFRDTLIKRKNENTWFLICPQCNPNITVYGATDTELEDEIIKHALKGYKRVGKVFRNHNGHWFQPMIKRDVEAVKFKLKDK